MNNVRLVFILGLPALLQLAGCTATKYEPQYLDSPTPNFAVTPICARVDGQLMHLDLEGRKDCMALVRASDWLTRTPLIAREGEYYAFTVGAGQFWYDATERIESSKGSRGEGIKNVAQDWKRCKNSDWFALIATTVSADDDKQTDEFQAQDVGVENVMHIKHAGQLAMYPNDAHGLSIVPEMFYKNNHGQIWVHVQRLAGVPAQRPVQVCMR